LNSHLKQYWKPAVWAIVVLLLSIIPGDDLDQLPSLPIPHLDKIGHFILYFVLALLLSAAVSKTRVRPVLMILIVLLTTTYGGTMELMQLLVHGRSADWFDFLANASGAITAVILMPLFRKMAFFRWLR
jgi:VanZ family protein